VSLLWVHSSLDLLLVFAFFLKSKFVLFLQQFLISVISELSKSISVLPGKPCSDMTLNMQSGLLSLFLPHCTREVLLWIDDFVLSLVNIEACLLHLNTKLSHHDSRFSLILVSLYLPLIFVWVIVRTLISLCEGVVVCLTCPVVSESTEVWLLFVLLIDFNSDDLYLIVS
jgi:hypothetical protein